MKTTTVRRLIGTTLLAGVVGVGTIASASPPSESQKYTSVCSTLSGNSRIVCDATSTTKSRATLASFVRIYGGPLDDKKDKNFAIQLASVYDALANPQTSSACVEDIRRLVILPTIQQNARTIQAKDLYNSWVALNEVLNAFDYVVSLQESGWRGPLLKRYFLDKIPRLTGVQQDWGKWAARSAFELGNETIRRYLKHTAIPLLITNCQGTFVP